MPSPLRILEMLIFSLISFLPYVLLMVYPHRKQLRYGSSLTALFAVLAFLFQIGLTMMAGLELYGDLDTVLAADIVIFTLLFLVIVSAPMGKKLFTMFSVLNLFVLITLAAGYLEMLIFPAYAPSRFNWADTLMTVLLQLVLLMPCAFYWTRIYGPAISQGKSKSPWGFLWLLPGICTAAGLCLHFLAYPKLTVIGIIVLLSAFCALICCILIRSSSKRADEPQPKPEVKKPAPEAPMPAPRKEPDSPLQILQYTNLQERIVESNQIHQELRRHMDLMARHLEKKEYEKLRTHITALREQLAGGDGASYSENEAINTVLSYFMQQAGYYGTRMTVKAAVPTEITVAGKDLSVLLGNLLDNALEACKVQQSSDRRIAVAVSTTERVLYLTVENTYDTPARKDENGHYLSSRHDGRGIGIEVCLLIAQRYNGELEISEANGLFKVTVSMML